MHNERIECLHVFVTYEIRDFAMIQSLCSLLCSSLQCLLSKVKVGFVRLETIYIFGEEMMIRLMKI